jgi:hypothetical protein
LKKKKSISYVANKPKIKVLTWYFYILEGRKIFQKSLGVASQENLRALGLGQGFSNFFCLRPSQLLLKILRPSLMLKYLYFWHVSSKISKNPPYLTIGDPFQFFGDPQKGRDP